MLFLVLQISKQFLMERTLCTDTFQGSFWNLTRHKIKSWCQMQGWWVCWKTIMLTLKLRLMEKKNWGVISNQQEEIKSSPMSQICLRQQRLTMNYAPKKTVRKDLKIQKGWADTNKDTSALSAFAITFLRSSEKPPNKQYFFVVQSLRFLFDSIIENLKLKKLESVSTLLSNPIQLAVCCWWKHVDLAQDRGWKWCD